MATKIVRKNTARKEKSDDTSVVSTPIAMEATAEYLTYVQPARHRQVDLGEMAWRISRTMIERLRVATKRSESSPRSRPAARATGLLPADWEYLTSIAATVQPDFWARMLVAERYVSERKRS